MKNKNGFTLVELLAVILIIGFIAGIAAIAYTTIVQNSENAVFEAYEKTMRAEAMDVLINHVELAPKDGQTVYYGLKTLEIDDFINPKDKNDLCPNSYVIVTRSDTVGGVNNYDYQACLICNDYNTDTTKCSILDPSVIK